MNKTERINLILFCLILLATMVGCFFWGYTVRGIKETKKQLAEAQETQAQVQEPLRADESVEDTLEPIILPESVLETEVETTPETDAEIEVVINTITEPAPNGVKLARDCWTKEEVATVMARTIFCEARGMSSVTEQACVCWTILNRVDPAQYPRHIVDIILSPNQFAYREGARTVDDYGRDLVLLALDIMDRYERELAGEEDVGRVLPKEYKYFWGDDYHNYFRITNYDYNYWTYELESPYPS